MSTVGTVRIDDNLVQDSDGAIRCVHCNAVVGARGDETYLAKALRVSRPSAAAGPQVRIQPGQFVDRTVSFRQICCFGCGVALVSEVIPDDEPSYRRKSL
jgi:hypothetical protein